MNLEDKLKKNLKEKFPNAVVDMQVVDKGKSSICLTFYQAREAIEEEFRFLKEFAIDNNCSFDEDKDYKAPKELFFYLIYPRKSQS